MDSIYTPVDATVYGKNVNRIKPLSAAHIPLKIANTLDTLDDSPQLFVRGTTLVYYVDGNFYDVGGGGAQDLQEVTDIGNTVSGFGNTLSLTAGDAGVYKDDNSQRTDLIFYGLLYTRPGGNLTVTVKDDISSGGLLYYPYLSGIQTVPISVNGNYADVDGNITLAGGGGDTNFAYDNLTASGNRLHDFAGFNLDILNTNIFIIGADIGDYHAGTTGNVADTSNIYAEIYAANSDNDAAIRIGPELYKIGGSFFGEHYLPITVNGVYADSSGNITIAGGGVTASNGLDVVGGDVVLGGALTGATTITGAAHNLTFIGHDTVRITDTGSSSGIEASLNVSDGSVSLAGHTNATNFGYIQYDSYANSIYYSVEKTGTGHDTIIQQYNLISLHVSNDSPAQANELIFYPTKFTWTTLQGKSYIQGDLILGGFNGTSSCGILVHGTSISGTETRDASAILELRDSSRGFLPSRNTTGAINSISSPAEALIMYDTTLHAPKFYNGTAWTLFATGSGVTWETFQALTIGGTTNWDTDVKGHNTTLFLTMDTTFNVTNDADGEEGNCYLTQDGTGGWFPTVPSGDKVADGAAVVGSPDKLDIAVGAGDTTLASYIRVGSIRLWTKNKYV